MIENIQTIKKEAAVFILEHESMPRHELIEKTVEYFKREIAGDAVSSSDWVCLASELTEAHAHAHAHAHALDLDLDLDLDLAEFVLGKVQHILPKVDTPKYILDRVQFLDMDCWHEDEENIHECNTTHCMSGFAELAHGKAGEYIVEHFGHEVGGHILFLHSTGRTVDFHCSNDEAIKTLKEMAGEA